MRLELEAAWSRGEIEALAGGGCLVTSRNADLLSLLRFDDCSIELPDGSSTAPEAMIITDGSGQGDALGKGGFGGLVVTTTEVHILLGGSAATNSGLMEMAATMACIEVLALREVRGRILHVTDYESWTKASLGALRAQDYRSITEVTTWKAAVDGLACWLQEQPASNYHRAHVHSHAEVEGNWAQNLNEVCDKLAALAKTLANQATAPDEALPEGPHPGADVFQWCIPATCSDPTPEARRLQLLGPTHQEEVEAARKTRTGKSSDVWGLTNVLTRAAPYDIDESLARESNAARYDGRSARYGDHIVGIHRGLAKKPAGTHHITAPDTMRAIHSSILASRIRKAAMDGRCISKVQKCNC
jgi:hypothetical protein